MKTHELKLGTTIFGSTKLKTENIMIINSVPTLEVGDTLELICFELGNYYRETKVFLDGDGPWGLLEITDKENADTLKTKITCVLPASEVNEGGISVFEEKLMPIIEAAGRNNSYEDFISILKNRFESDRLPDGLVIIGIEVVK
ncbi:hypothetical protein [Lactococcus taiwanensis]|uniref:hypothetical protein n=1 Tax=Lactococcus taiwanensis TaxID=1151742 RepID=UPI00289D0090|nr:hypothetical protein [Lactococcus taiwanensis]